MKATPFLIIEDNKITHSGRLASQIGEGFWLVQFDQPRPHSRVLPTAELTRFVLFRNDEERNAFVAPPATPSAPPAPPAEPPAENPAESKKTAEEHEATRKAIAKLRKEFAEKARETIAEKRLDLLDSQPQVPCGN